MNRTPYRTRLRKRISQDTVAFFKARLVPLAIAITGLLISYLCNPLHVGLDFLLRSVVVVALSYGAAFVGALLFNTVRAPWLLDEESGQLIDQWEKNAQTAETTLAELKNHKEENRRHHREFAELIQSGVALSTDLTTYQVPTQFNAWDVRFSEWKAKVKQAISELGFDADAIAFMRAGDIPPPVAGVIILGHYREMRNRALKQHVKELEDIVRRRLP